MIQSPFNNIIVKIDTKYLEHFGTMIKVANMNYASQINPADYVNIVGEIVSAPKAISKRIDYTGFSTKNIKTGDKILFRYDVIFEFLEYTEGDIKFKNVFWYQGQDYWICDIQKAFAILRGDEIIMLNGYCMVQNMEVQPNIYLPTQMKQAVKVSSATLVAINDNLEGIEKIGANIGDRVFYKGNRMQSYKVKEKIFGIISQKDILGKEIKV